MAEETCPKCGGSGWIIVERDGLSGAERCDCALVSRARHVEENSGIPPLYRAAAFDTFRLPADNPVARNQLSMVMTIANSYAREFPATEKPGLLLIGDPGTGKTHLAVAALKKLMSRGFEGVFFDYQNLLVKIRSGYDAASGQSDREAYRQALDAEILLLDDLGAHRVSDWVEDTVTSIVTYRCNNQKPLIATTNLPDAEFDRLQEKDALSGQYRMRRSLGDAVGMRARSRLFEMCRVVKMPAVEDYRMRKAR